MRKFFLILFMFASAFIYAEVYKIDFEKIGGDVDYLVFINETSDDLLIRYSFCTTCDICSVKQGKKNKIRVGIDAGRHAIVSVAVTFETKTKEGIMKPVSWSMDGKHNDINIYLQDDNGWEF